MSGNIAATKRRISDKINHLIHQKQGQLSTRGFLRNKMASTRQEYQKAMAKMEKAVEDLNYNIRLISSNIRDFQAIYDQDDPKSPSYGPRGTCT